MQKYVVAIEETIVQKFEILAESEDEALDLAVEKYNIGEFVLDHSEIHHKQVALVDDENGSTEWIEF